MSSHFTYEIDERKLRVKLKDFEMPYDEEAWKVFEAAEGTSSRGLVSSRISNIRVPLNRQVIVPAAFGILIIVFSFLLFNFIDIKKPAAAPTQDPQTEQIVIPEPEKQTVTAATVQPTLSQTPLPANSSASETVSKTTLATQTPTISTLPKNKTLAKPVSALSSAGSSTLSAATIQNVRPESTLGISTGTNQPGKKNRKQRVVDEADSDSSRESRANMTNDERDTGERPN